MSLMLLIFAAGLGTLWFTGTHAVGECKAQVAEEKRLAAERRVKLRRSRQMFESAQPGPSAAQPGETTSREKVRATGTEGYRNIFDPGNLKGQVGVDSEDEQ